MILTRKGRTNPMEELAAKIQRLSLTHAERRIAEYILEHLNTIGLQTSTALAQDIDHIKMPFGNQFVSSRFFQPKALSKLLH